MSTGYNDLDLPPRRSFATLAVLIAIAFLAGLGLTAWLIASSPTVAGLLGIRQPPVTAAPAPVAAPLPRPAPVPVVAVASDPAVDRRLAALEAKIGSIDVQAREAVGNADRAEGLLIAFAARRALDRGVGLGYLESLLRQRFGNSQPQAVATILAASNRPVTVQGLREQLESIGPELVAGSPTQSWWGAFKQEFADLVTVRRGESPSTMPSARLERAKQQLEAGQVSSAMAEVNRLPGWAKAGTLFADARRYLAARDALDRIETAALLDQRPETAAE